MPPRSRRRAAKKQPLPASKKNNSTATLILKPMLVVLPAIVDFESDVAADDFDFEAEVAFLRIHGCRRKRCRF